MRSKIISDTAIEGRGSKEKKETRSTILCVDDEKMMLSILFEQLDEWFGSNYRIEKALSGGEALEIVDRCIQEEEPISVIITDYMMPHMKGDELLIEIRKRDSKIRNIMLTGYTSVSGIITAINQAGLYRFIPKPWDVKDLMLTIMEAIKSYEQEKKMRDLAKGFESLYRKCEDSTQHAVDALVSTIQAVDPELAAHSMRVRQYAIWLAKKLELDEGICKSLKYASVLHGIGTLGSGTHGNVTYGSVDGNEVTDIRNNLEAKGSQVIEDSQEEAKATEEMLRKQINDARKIISHLGDAGDILKGVQYQFEKYDGSGLFRKKGEEIPEEARVLAVVHYYDGVKTGSNNGNIAVKQMVEKLESRKGTWFDPRYVDEFVKILLSVK